MAMLLKLVLLLLIFGGLLNPEAVLKFSKVKTRMRVLSIYGGLLLLVVAFTMGPSDVGTQESPGTNVNTDVTKLTPEVIIERCGKPDVDDSTAYDDPRPALVTRMLDYNKVGVRFLCLAKGEAGTSPPYEWKIMGVTDPNTNQAIEVREAARRLPCWTKSAQSNQTQTSGSGLDSHQFTEKLGKKISGRNGLDVEVTKYKKTDVEIDVYYRSNPSSFSQVRSDTTFVARKALEVLVEAGVSPSKDWVFLFVHAYKRGHGETGKEILRSFGQTSYDFNTDQLVWEPATN